MTASPIGGGSYLNVGPERIIYGSPAGEVVRAEAERLGARRVFVTSSASLASLAMDGKGPLAEVQRGLGSLFAGAFVSLRAHTPREDVVAAARQARQASADLVVAIGGGSVIDATKALLLCAWYNLDEAASMEPFRMGAPDQRAVVPPAEPLRIIAVSTTLSAAELTTGAGVTEPASRVKQSFRHPLLVPRTAVLDPRATLFTPLPLLLATGMRAVDHAIESYCSLHAHWMSEAHAVTGLRLLTQALPSIAADPLDVTQRLNAQLGMWQATLGATSGAGTGASHGIGYALGAAFDVPHGVTSCVMLPAVLRYNASINHGRQQALAAAIGRPGESLPDLVQQMVLKLGLPSTLTDAGVTRAQWSELAQRALMYEPVKRNPRTIRDEHDVMEILSLAA